MKFPDWRQTLVLADKVFLKVGALLGAVSALILFVRSEVLRPTPPELDLRFMLSSEATLNYAQPLLDPVVKFTELVPLSLTLKNGGDMTAKNVVLTFIADETMDSEVQGIPAEALNVVSEKGFKRHYVIKIGDLHPDETKVLDANIWCSVMSINRTRVSLMFEDESTRRLPVAETQISYDLEARVSAENLPSKVVHLYLNTSLEEKFAKKAPYFTFARGVLTYHPLEP